MAVTLTFSPTIDGVSFSDALEGGGTGLSFGNVINGTYSPMGDQVQNEGAMDVYMHHDATTDPITNVELFLQVYGASSGFTYGGQRSGVNDYDALLLAGDNSGSSKNNLDGMSGGIWVDMNWDAETLNQFDITNFPTVVKIFGKNDEGININNGIIISNQCMVYDDTGETGAITPEDGKIGKSGDSILGTNAHLKFRIYLPTAWTEGGNYQVELACAYRYTA
jgi:hypothetical protein